MQSALCDAEGNASAETYADGCVNAAAHVSSHYVHTLSSIWDYVHSLASLYSNSLCNLTYLEPYLLCHMLSFGCEIRLRGPPVPNVRDWSVVMHV